jgi:hypothetical protein
MPSVSVQKREQQEQFIRQQRDAILKAAGIDTERRMKTLNKAFTRLEEQLDAQKSIVVDKAEVQVPDNQARLRAIEQVVDLEGVSLGKSHDGGSSGPVTITINAPWFESAPTTGSGEGHVVEIGHANLLIDNESQ